MRIIAISQHECSELLKRLYIGRLGCALDNQPYIIPVHFSYEPNSIYIFSTLGKKIEWMRQNPKVCLQTDEIVNGLEWLSVIVTGTYLELTGPQHEAQRKHAQERLAEYSEWSNSIYIFSTLGKKIEWMRQNPKVCLQTDEIVNGLEWLSVIVTGTYLELTGPQHEAQRKHAQERLAEYSEWWRIPLAERREQTTDLSIQTVFFRIDIGSMSGLRAKYELEETAPSWRPN